MDEKKLNNILSSFINFNDINFKARQQYIDIYKKYKSLLHLFSSRT